MSGVLHGVVASLAGRVRDAFFRYVTLLLNTSATNGAQNNTFLDSSTNNFSITRNGDTTQGSFNPYMPSGYWSGYFDGAGDYLGCGSQTAYAMGAGDFTWEAWIYFPSGAAYRQILSTRTTTGSVTTQGSLAVNPSNGLTWYTNTFIVNYTTSIGVNQWVHVAVCRSGTSLRVFANGTQVGVTATNSDNLSENTFSVGANGDGSEPFIGYISNARVVKGTAVYTAAFTPPTTPLTAITNTSLLCLQDNRFKDNSTNAFTITRNGDTRISKFAPFNPPASYSTASYGGSGYFDGTGDYLGCGSQTAYAVGTGVFTVEAFVYVTTLATESNICSTRGSPGTVNGWSFAVNTSGGISFYSNNFIFNTTNQIPANTWVHVAIVREGTGTNQTKLYINGTNTNSATNSQDFTNTTLAVGCANDGSQNPMTGYISSFRLVKGTAVYTANFTPPTAPLTAITNTSLLLNFTNAGIFDAATINNGQTVGNAQVSTTQAKWGTTSLAFDGTGDYVTVIDKPELRIGTGDFTIEGWVYLNATGVAYGLVSKGTATTGWSVNVTSGNKLQFSYTATQLTGATSLASGTWYYFAVVRSGTASGNLKVWLNGSTDATSAGAVNDNFNQTNVLYVGADRVAGAVLNGYLQDVRITNGYARTTSTPTSAFPTL